MKIMAMLVVLPSAFFVAQAQAAPAIPILPASESFVYSRTIGDKRDEVGIGIRLVSIGGVSRYELSSHASEQDMFIKLDPVTLFANYIEVTSRAKDATLRRVTEVLENKSSPGPDELVISGFESLPWSLRAFPWGSRQKAKVSFMNSGAGGSFSFDFAVTGKETVTAAGRGIECWKAQLSLGGFFGAFVGKSLLWYAVEYPHYLVKSEGSSGGPGTPTSVLLLVRYSRE